MSKDKQRFIYLGGKPIPVNEEVYHIWYQPIWRTHDFARRHGQCSCANWHLCEGDCFICRFRMDGENTSLDRLYDDYEYEPEDSSHSEDIALDLILLEELLDELEEIDPDGRRIGKVLLDGLTDREAAETLGMPTTTYSSKKLKLRRELKKRRRKEK